MKKTTLTLIAVLISAITFSQTFYKVSKSSYSTYDNDNWVTKETTYPERMFVIANKYNIKITNESESNFIMYGEVETKTYSTHTAYTWNAYDKEGRQCTIIYKVGKNDSTGNCYLSILYGLYCFEYNLTIQK